jgi:hypothetical protein
MARWLRWSLTVVAALTASGGDWWVLSGVIGSGHRVAILVAAVPFLIVLAVLRPWAADRS